MPRTPASDLFSTVAAAPLAERMRPRTLDELVGQPRLSAADAPLRRALEAARPYSMILWGPPGCGKTLCAEIFAAELGLPMFVVKLDRLISSYLGETAANIRKTFEFARKQPCVLFFDEFDALARSRDDTGEHNELRRVVNSLLLFIDRMQPRGFLIAATNLDGALDPAIWRRFDEVIWFEKPDRGMIERYLRQKFKNVATSFDPVGRADELMGFSFAEIERVAIQAIKTMIIDRRKQVQAKDFNRALADEKRRRNATRRAEPMR